MGVWDVWCKGDEDLSWARDRVIFYFLFVVVLVIEFLGVWGDFFGGHQNFDCSLLLSEFLVIPSFMCLSPFDDPG